MRPVEPPRPWRGRLVVLAGVLLVALNLRVAVAAVSPILDLLRADVPFTAGHAGLLGTAPVVTFAVFGALAPALGRRLGLEPALVGAMLLSAGGEVLRAAADDAAWFLAWSVVALAGMGLGNVLLPPLVKRYFPDRIGAVTAAYTVAMAFSTAVPPLLAVPVAAALGWRPALASWAAVGVLAAVPWIVVVARSALARRGLRDVLAHGPARVPSAGRDHHAPGRVWRSPLAWAMTVTFAMNTTNVYVAFAWLPEILRDAGASAADAGRWLALFGVLGAVSALVVPPLAVRVRHPWWLVVVFVALFVVAYVGLLVAPGGAMPLWVTCLGVAPGAFPLVLTLVGVRTRTASGAASLSGFVQGFGYALAGAGPFAVGALHEATGGWTAVLVAMLGTVAVLGVAGTLACRPRMLEDTWGSPGRPAGTTSAGRTTDAAGDAPDAGPRVARLSR